MLDVNSQELLKKSWVVIFAREAVLVVDISLCLKGFSIKSSYFDPYLVLTLHNRLFK